MITTEGFTRRFGRAPVNDDLDRVNCNKAGAIGHWQCGVCHTHEQPRFSCGCILHEEHIVEPAAGDKSTPRTA